MKLKDLLLVGAGGHAKACIDVIENEGRFNIAGLIGLPNEVGTKLLGYPVIGTDSDLASLSTHYRYAFVTQGQIRSADKRVKTFNQLSSLGYELPYIVAKTAYVAPRSTIQSGTIVMHRAIINAAVTIGVNCIINTCALIEHDVQIGNHSHISTGAILNGSVRVGSGTFIGSNSVLKNGIVVGNNSVVGMGLSITRGVPDQTILKSRMNP